MRVDFVKEQVSLDANISYSQAKILQKALQAEYTGIITDPSGTNMTETIQDLEDLAEILGVIIDTSVEGVEQNSV